MGYGLAARPRGPISVDTSRLLINLDNLGEGSLEGNLEGNLEGTLKVPLRNLEGT